MGDNYMWTPTIDQYLEAVELAYRRGVKPGESMENEFLEIMKKYDKKPDMKINKDSDMLTGELRDKGYKVLNMSEQRRKNEDK